MRSNGLIMELLVSYGSEELIYLLHGDGLDAAWLSVR